MSEKIRDDYKEVIDVSVNRGVLVYNSSNATSFTEFVLTLNGKNISPQDVDSELSWEKVKSAYVKMLEDGIASSLEKLKDKYFVRDKFDDELSHFIGIVRELVEFLSEEDAKKRKFVYQHFLVKLVKERSSQCHDNNPTQMAKNYLLTLVQEAAENHSLVADILLKYTKK